MKKMFSKIASLIMTLTLLFMTGCVEDLASYETKSDRSIQQVEEKTEADKATEPHTESITIEDPNKDTMLGIAYPRPSGSPPLQNGSRGDEVYWLQTALNKAMNANLIIDGDFGNGTASKVTEFQSRCGLSADGVAGTATIAMLVDILSGNRKMPEAPKVTSPPATSPPARTIEQPAAPAKQSGSTYVLNTNTHKFHYSSCSSVSSMNDSNKDYYSGSRDDVIAMGYEPCKRCNP